MQKKEVVLTLGLLSEKDACDRGIEEFKRWYPSGHATLTEVLRKLQILANTALNPLKYVDYAKWLVNNYPPTQEPLVLTELTEKVIIHNGNIDIKSSIDGNHIIIGNGDLNIEDDVNLTGRVVIQAKNVKGQNITLYDFADISAAETIKATNIAAHGNAGIWAGKTIKAINIAAHDFAGISVEETIKATNIAAYGLAGIDVGETIKATNIAAYGNAGIWAYEINTQSIISNGNIYAKISLIQPSSN
ncbi:hypothetical protein BHC43_00215 [Snodgrassella alvi]|uniref:hypothetical protein n=1 Tax=Snodgrassella alvi TaxID=1196083 RepID=UPI000C1EFE46|nr:hypothetical protein [Snodgrassella alvi]PIT41832.1 hypothetical protein BHC43_00215 [Snodgrassella alvi]